MQQQQQQLLGSSELAGRDACVPSIGMHNIDNNADKVKYQTNEQPHEMYMHGSFKV
jgi:hypothetical protein